MPLTLYERPNDPVDLAAELQRLIEKGLNAADARGVLQRRYPHLVVDQAERVAIRKNHKEPLMKTAWDDITTLAKRYVSEGTAPTLEQGVDRVIRDNPDWYQRFLVEPPPPLPEAPQPAPVQKSAYQGCLELMAKRYVAEGAAPTLEQGYVLACDERPDLLAQALQAERQRARRG